MIQDIRDITLDMLDTTWPMLVISCLVAMVLRITYLVINGKKFVLYEELLKLFFDEDEEILNIYIFSNKIIFKFNNIIFQSRLINGSYPNTVNLIPEETLFDLRINKREFYNMVDRASILNNDRDNNIITLEINNNLLKITSMSLEIGKVEEKLAVNCSDNIKISFSSKYMMDALRTISTEDVIISFVGEIKPILLRESSNNDLIGLILPIRTY